MKKNLVRKKFIAIVLLIAAVCFLFFYGSISRQETPMILETELINYGKQQTNINKHYKTYSSESLFYKAFMFHTSQNSRFVLYERPGSKEDGYLLLDNGSMICDQYGIDFRRYGNGSKVLIMIDDDSYCKRVLLECRGNKKILMSFDVSAPQIIFVDLEEWGDIEKVDYISFRTNKNIIIREERIL